MKSRLSKKIRSGNSEYWITRSREFYFGGKKDHRVAKSEKMVGGYKEQD